MLTHFIRNSLLTSSFRYFTQVHSGLPYFHSGPVFLRRLDEKWLFKELMISEQMRVEGWANTRNDWTENEVTHCSQRAKEFKGEAPWKESWMNKKKTPEKAWRAILWNETVSCSKASCYLETRNWKSEVHISGKFGQYIQEI